MATGESGITYTVTLSKAAREYFIGLPKKQKKIAVAALDDLETNPHCTNLNVVYLRGSLSGYLRYRKGDHRVVYTLDNEKRAVHVVWMGNRRDAYK